MDLSRPVVTFPRAPGLLGLLECTLRGQGWTMFAIWKRSGERTQVRFMPGCLVWSIVLSIALTLLLNLLIRLF